jgi:lipoprotein-anchoring transpeptidase ErfK/SrfK
MRRSTIATAIFAALTFAAPAFAYDIDPLTGQPVAPIEDGRAKASPIARTEVAYNGPHRPGTIVIDTNERRLYLVMPGNRAMRYGVGVGRPGFEWAGTKKITRKAEWPDWRPPAQMRKRRPDLPVFMAGGPNNPLGARAMYLGSSLFRIHGSNEPETIGQAVSSGCIRMLNPDVIDLYERVKVGTTVVVKR